MPYSKPQLGLLLAFAATLLLGLLVREWRAGFPELAERLERFDLEEPVAPRSRRDAAPGAPPQAATAARDATVVPAPGPAGALDINRASRDELARLPGIGAGLADRIVAERQRRGRFDSPEALRYVPGMGPKRLAAIRALIAVGE